MTDTITRLKERETNLAERIRTGHNNFNRVEHLFSQPAIITIANENMVFYILIFFDQTILFHEKHTYETKLLKHIIN